MKKVTLLIGLIIIALLVIGGIFVWRITQRSQADSQDDNSKKKRISLPTNIIPLDERPYLEIVPIADGKHLRLVVRTVKKPADLMDYELEYQTGSLLQGAFDSLEISQLPTETTIKLGSCSAGGACTYHEDIKGGTLLTRFQGPQEYALKSDWRYFDNQAGDTEFSSKDAKFQLSSANLSKQRYIIIFNTAGYPGKLPGTAVSDPYSLTASGPLTGEGELAIRANEEGELMIVAWNGNKWIEYDSQVDGKMVTAQVELLPLYIVVKP